MTSPFSTAIQKKDPREAKELASNPSINLNAFDETGMTPLLEAISQDAEEVAIAIYDSGRANPNISTRKGSTPLMTAIVKKHKRLITKILNHKPSVELWAKKTNNPLLNAVEKENQRIKKNNYIDLLPTNHFCTALDYAAQSNQHDVIEQILDKAAELPKQNTDFHTHALLIAVTFGSQESAEVLIKRGANREHVYLLDCAAASEKYQTAEKTAQLVESLIKKGAKTEEWKYHGNNPGVRIIYRRTQLANKELKSLVSAEHKQDMQELIGLVSDKNNTKLNNQCCAMIARIAYAHHIHSVNKNDNDMITACRYWSKITDINDLEPVDKQLFKATGFLPPMWVRGSAFDRYSQHMFKLSNDADDKQHIIEQFDKTGEKVVSLQFKPKEPTAQLRKFDNLIDNALNYLEKRNSETHSNWFVASLFGYSNDDYQLRRDIGDKITLLKLEYHRSGDGKHLLAMKEHIEEALKKKEITGRNYFSSHRFADHLRTIKTFITTIPEFKTAEKEKEQVISKALFGDRYSIN